MNFPQFIAWAATAEGIQAIIGLAISWIVEWFPEWKTLSSFRKRLYVLIACLVIPLLASLVGVLTGYSPNSIEVTWWPSLEAGMAAFVSSQIIHGMRNRTKKA